MAETAITAVLSKFGELAANEAKILLDVGDNMMLLRDRLQWLQAFIFDADRKRRAGTDQFTRVWLRQTRDVAFEAEDALDEFFYEVDLQRQGYRAWKMWCKFVTGVCTQIAIRHGLSARLKRINTRLEKISENQKKYKIEHTPLAPATSSTTAPSAWRDGYKYAVGFQDDIKTLKDKLLCQDHLQQMFISILGERGVGKATLVDIVTTDEDVVNHFEVNIECKFSQDMTTEDLLQLMYMVVHKYFPLTEERQPDEGTDIVDRLRCILGKRRYLVNIRGISSKTLLNCVRASLPDDSNGSRVLLVLDTENEEVAWHANTFNKDRINTIHLLTRLNEGRSGQLFCSRAFRKDLYDEKENMNKYDKIVYHITGGHPLAIVVLAGLLRFKEKPGQWEAVLQQFRPELGMEEAQGGEGNQIIRGMLSNGKRVEWQMSPATKANLSTRATIEKVFWASFEELPNDLKSCFLYFATYPKEFHHYANSIVWKWIAEGFIKPQKGKTLEELGHGYLQELVLRCLVETVELGEGEPIYFIVHKSLHGFLQLEAREAGFVEVHDMQDVFVPPSVRRLSFVNLEGGNMTFANKFRKLRSFLCWLKEEDQSNDTEGARQQHWHDLKFLCGSKFLRLIFLFGLRIRKLPDEIGDLIHLRYLRIMSNDLKVLPSSIKRLLNLQTLDIRQTQVEHIHPCFWKIKTLRHVLAEGLRLPNVLTEELDELQTLNGVKPSAEGEWHQQNCPLHKMTKLRNLCLFGIEHARHGPALDSALRKMSLLDDLMLEGDEIPSCVLTAHSLRYLKQAVLFGIIKWPEVGWDVKKVRPNLARLILAKDSSPPQHIVDEILKD